MKYGFIGCGNMGGALARALSKTTKDIVLADFSPQKAKALADELGVKSGTNSDVASGCERIFLGVKPQVMEEMLGSIKDILKEKKPLLISMAAGLTTDKICEMAGGDIPVIRIMPNTPVSVSEGMILYCANSLVGEQDIKDFVSDMRFGGMLDALDEELMDAGCSVSGCGPAFMYMFIEALAQGGEACGLPRDKAVKYAAATMAGAARLALTSDKTPEELRIAVCSPGGSTLEGVKVLNEARLTEIGIDTVKASYKRNIELGRGSRLNV